MNKEELDTKAQEIFFRKHLELAVLGFQSISLDDWFLKCICENIQ